MTQSNKDKAPGNRAGSKGDTRAKEDDGSLKGSGEQESDDSGVEEAREEVQEVVDEETEKGFRGTEVDTTPNENYTVQGVGSDPEGVPEAAEFKQEAQLEATNPEVRARH
jgi:hypothetical protein